MNKSLFTAILLANPAFAQTAEKNESKAGPSQILEEKNKLADQKLKAELAELTAKLARVKLEKELLLEEAELATLKREKSERVKDLQFEKRRSELERMAALAKFEAALANSELKKLQAKYSKKSIELQAQIEQFDIEQKRNDLSLLKPIALDNPLLDDGTLVISDRRIALNGPIQGSTADYITSRIHFYNNRDKKKPIFIVIDDCPGGSVMAGYRILEAIDGSDAPIHVVVKSFAASMAATITTLAEHSYAYPNAIILHHQISSTVFGSFTLTEQKEFYEDSKKWWERLAKPIAKKMGITTDEFIKQMYQKNSLGDWTEFATEAKKLKWVNTIVHRIKETSQLSHPKLTEKKEEETQFQKLKVDDKGRTYEVLPRLTPKDVYFLYNPDSYYRMK